MTDAPLVAKKLALIETCVRELRELCRPEQIERDVREEEIARMLGGTMTTARRHARELLKR